MVVSVEEHHAPAQCKKVSSIKATKHVIIKLGLCFTCLRCGIQVGIVEPLQSVQNAGVDTI